MPSGKGQGRYSLNSRAKALATKHTRWLRTLYPVAALAYGYGARPSTFIKLDIKNWDPITKRLTLFRKQLKTKENKVTGELEYFIVDNFMSDLINTCAAGRGDDEPLFLNVRGNRWKTCSFSHAFARFLRHIGFQVNELTRDTFYALRHTGAKEVCRRFNGDLALLRIWLKHSPTSPMALRYIADLRTEQDQERLAKRHNDGESHLKQILAMGDQSQHSRVIATPESDSHLATAKDPARYPSVRTS